MSTTRIKVVVRARSFLPSEEEQGYHNSKLRFDCAERSVRLESKSFSFDQLFPPGSTQEQVFQGCNIKYLVQRVIEGYHCTVFAYGQTSAGKTFTLDGYSYESNRPAPPADKRALGVIPRAVKQLFQQISERRDRNYSVYFSFMQLYNEKIYDLLNPAEEEAGLRLRWSQNEQFSVQNLFVYECSSEHQLLELFGQGLSKRVTASHRLNQSSSRSHAISMIRVESYDKTNPSLVQSSKLYFVDLAGSQRIGLTGAEGKHAKESIEINKSLFTLRMVINSLVAEPGKAAARREFVPYRDSKLTSILKQSIGGNSYCLMIACINPNDQFIEESVSTLTYAAKAACITNRPVRNEDPQTKVIVALKHQLSQLESRLDLANQRIKNKQEEDSLDKPLPPQHFSEHLVQSIRVVRQLLKSNKELREQLQAQQRHLLSKNEQLLNLQRQNQRLRDPAETYAKRSALVGKRGDSVHSRARPESQTQLNGKKRQPSETRQRGWAKGTGFGLQLDADALQSFGSVQINQYFVRGKEEKVVTKRLLHPRSKAEARQHSAAAGGRRTRLD